MKTLSRLMLANFINDLVLGGLIHFIFNSFGRSHCSSRVMSKPMNSTCELERLSDPVGQPLVLVLRSTGPFSPSARNSRTASKRAGPTRLLADLA